MWRDAMSETELMRHQYCDIVCVTAALSVAAFHLSEVGFFSFFYDAYLCMLESVSWGRSKSDRWTGTCCFCSYLYEHSACRSGTYGNIRIVAAILCRNVNGAYLYFDEVSRSWWLTALANWCGLEPGLPYIVSQLYFLLQKQQQKQQNTNKQK